MPTCKECGHEFEVYGPNIRTICKPCLAKKQKRGRDKRLPLMEKLEGHSHLQNSLKARNLIVLNKGHEMAFLDVFKREALPAIENVPTIIYGTPGPLTVDNRTSKINAMCMFLVYELVCKGLKDISIIIGNLVDANKAQEKALQFRELFNVRTAARSVDEFEFHDLLREIHKREQPTQIIFLMSGEWKDYLRSFNKAVAKGLRNLTIWIMKRRRGNGFELGIWRC